MKLYIMESGKVYDMSPSTPSISIDPKAGLVIHGFNGSIILPKGSRAYDTVHREDKEYANKLLGILKTLMIKKVKGADYLFYELSIVDRIYNMGKPGLEYNIRDFYDFLINLSSYEIGDFLLNHGLYISRISNIDLAYKNFIWLVYYLVGMFYQFSKFKISLENIMNQFISQNSCPQILIETHGFLPSKYSILLVKPWVKLLRFSTESDKLVVPILKKMTHRDEKTLFKEIMKVCKLSIDICNTLNELANSLKDAIYSFTTKVEELIEEYDIVYIVDPFSFLIEILEEINLFIKEGTSNIDNNSDLIKP